MVTLICRLQKKTISFKEKKPLTQHNNFNPRYNCYKLYRKYNKLVNGFQKLSAILILSLSQKQIDQIFPTANLQTLGIKTFPFRYYLKKGITFNLC